MKTLVMINKEEYKFYRLFQVDEVNFHSTWGPIGSGPEEHITIVRPIELWDKIVALKQEHGYEVNTSFTAFDISIGDPRVLTADELKELNIIDRITLIQQRMLDEKKKKT